MSIDLAYKLVVFGVVGVLGLALLGFIFALA